MKDKENLSLEGQVNVLEICLISDLIASLKKTVIEAKHCIFWLYIMDPPTSIHKDVKDEGHST